MQQTTITRAFVQSNEGEDDGDDDGGDDGDEEDDNHQYHPTATRYRLKNEILELLSEYRYISWLRMNSFLITNTNFGSGRYLSSSWYLLSLIISTDRFPNLPESFSITDTNFRVATITSITDTCFRFARIFSVINCGRMVI